MLMSSQGAQVLGNADCHHFYVLYLAQIFVPQVDCLLGCFRLEMLEVSGCTVLSCNIAWHAQAAHTDSQHGRRQAHDAESQDDCDSSRGVSSVQDAVAHALAALNGVKAPAVPAAPALQVHYQTLLDIYRESTMCMTSLPKFTSQTANSSPRMGVTCLICTVWCGLLDMLQD